MDLADYRKRIDEIDDNILRLFLERMNVVSDVADYKKKQGMAIAQRGREREILERISDNAGNVMEDYARVLFSTMFDLSRSYQNKRNSAKSGELYTRINKALKNTPPQFPKKGVVACQGIEGAYSQIACDRMFHDASILYVKNFEGVFSAVSQGLCRYGILPIENSIYGTVNQVYDLMKNYNFHIVRGIKQQINHALLAKDATASIREVFSHEQAIGQCSEYLKNHPEIKVTVCENTAVAAKLVSDSERADVAAISSPDCAAYYGLELADAHISNSDSNFTRFICISKELEIYPGADRISLMMNVSHTPGALYSLIARFAAAGLNLTKLESRPIPGKDFEFCFYFDLEASVYSEEVTAMIDEMNTSVDRFTLLGAYSQI